MSFNRKCFVFQIQTFSVEEPVYSTDDLLDGVTIAQILHQM